VGRSLLEILRDVAVDPGEQAALAEMGVVPYLARHGFHDVDADDVREVVDLVADTLPPEVAQTLTLAGSDVVRAVGLRGEVHVTASGDVTDELDALRSRPSGDHGGTVVHGDGAFDGAHPVNEGPKGHEASFTFGAGADRPAPDDVTSTHADPVPHGIDDGPPEGDPAGGVVAHDLAQDLDPAAGFEATAAYAGDIDEIGADEMPDDPIVLDDIGSF
jgi:hypothetical protein